MRSKKNRPKERGRVGISRRMENIMNCLCSGGQLRADQMVPSSEILAANDYLPSSSSSRAADVEPRQDTGNIEEAESSLRESGCLNYEVGCFDCVLLVFLSPPSLPFHPT